MKELLSGSPGDNNLEDGEEERVGEELRKAEQQKGWLGWVQSQGAALGLGGSWKISRF